MKRVDLPECPRDATHVRINPNNGKILMYYRWGNSPYSGGNYLHLFYYSSRNCWMGSSEKNYEEFVKNKLIKIVD